MAELTNELNWGNVLPFSILSDDTFIQFQFQSQIGFASSNDVISVLCSQNRSKGIKVHCENGINTPLNHAKTKENLKLRTVNLMLGTLHGKHKCKPITKSWLGPNFPHPRLSRVKE